MSAKLHICAGPAPREAIAQQIASAIGPSGPNDEYLYGLVRALQEVSAVYVPSTRRFLDKQGPFGPRPEHAWPQSSMTGSLVACGAMRIMTCILGVEHCQLDISLLAV